MVKALAFGLLSILCMARSATAADAPVEPTLPQMAVAKAWLQLLDAGEFEQAWNNGDPSLRKKGDLNKWRADVHKQRGTQAAVACRKGLDFELFSDPDRVSALFVTQFADGHAIGERVTLIDDANEVAHVSAYRVGPAPPDRRAACTP